MAVEKFYMKKILNFTMVTLLISSLAILNVCALDNNSNQSSLVKSDK